MFVRQVDPGIELRLVEQKEALELFQLIEQNRGYLREWLPWVDKTRSADDIRHFIQRAHGQFAANQGPTALIRVDGKVSGVIGCHPIDWANRHCSIGYWLTAGLQRKGVMTRCCSSLLDYLFDGCALHRVTIQCATGNHRSCAIPQRLGFTREGVMRESEWVNDRFLDLVVWGMLEHDWRARRGGSPV
jgi:ribosomal-protein-serine acetyltransferase